MRFIVAILVALAAFGVRAEGFYEYKSPALGFAINYANGWYVTEQTEKGTVSIVAPNAKLNTVAAILVIVKPVPAGATLASLDDNLANRMASGMGEFSVKLKQPGTVGGQAATMVLLEGTVSRKPFAAFMAYTIRGHKLYATMFLCERQHYDQYRDIGGAIIGSFRFI